MHGKSRCGHGGSHVESSSIFFLFSWIFSWISPHVGSLLKLFFYKKKLIILKRIILCRKLACSAWDPIYTYEFMSIPHWLIFGVECSGAKKLCMFLHESKVIQNDSSIIIQKNMSKKHAILWFLTDFLMKCTFDTVMHEFTKPNDFYLHKSINLNEMMWMRFSLWTIKYPP